MSLNTGWQDTRAHPSAGNPAARAGALACRMGEPGGWLGRLHYQWAESGLCWESFVRGWLDEHGLHPASVIRRELDARFAATHLSTGPYYFADLLDVDAPAEQAAIEAGQLKAGCLRYAGRRGATS
jgi:hypothetical protein